MNEQYRHITPISLNTWRLRKANKSKIILDLCGGTGAWSKPYVISGYDVRNITSPDYDVRTYIPPDNIYGILAAPPCTDFSGSGAQYWPIKDADGRTEESLSIFDACMSIIKLCNPIFWVLENPIGRLPKLRPELGKPKMRFNPCDYGDPWTKQTCLWGDFNIPRQDPIDPQFITDAAGRRYMPHHGGGRSKQTKIMRSITPPGFAKAFFEANR